MRRSPLPAALSLAALLTAGTASAQYQLRAEAFASAATPSAGMLVLSGESHVPTWLDADAVVWLGAGGGADVRGDVMVASVRAHAPGGWGEIKIGRMLQTAGGLRPLHLDGGSVVARAPWGTSVEVFGGSPVVPLLAQNTSGEITGLTPREYDWALGGRVAQRISEYGTLGVGYLQLRQGGVKAYDQLGVDALATPTSWLDAAFTGAIDMMTPTLANARVSLAGRWRGLRVEAYALRRSPAHLLPATSLFSALGDMPSERAGGSILWRAAPRLDLVGEGAVESLDDTPTEADPKVTKRSFAGSLGMFRATLRLDDRGDGALALEFRRNSVPATTGLQTVTWTGKSASWTGVRATARIPIGRLFVAATELELVAPDDPGARGKLWPWGLVGVRFTPDLAKRWEMAAAVEAGASPTATSAVTGLFRVAYTFGPTPAHHRPAAPAQPASTPNAPKPAAPPAPSAGAPAAPAPSFVTSTPPTPAPVALAQTPKAPTGGAQ